MRPPPSGLRTRCGVERYRPSVRRSSMSPRLQTSAPGTGGMSCHSPPVRTWRPPLVVLQQEGEQAVVGVLGHPPVAGAVGLDLGRVVEDPEQDRGVGRQVPGEPALVEAEADGEQAHQAVAEGGEGVEGGQHRRAELGRAGGEEVGPVQGEGIVRLPLRRRSRCPPCGRGRRWSARRPAGTSPATPARPGPWRSRPSRPRGGRRTRPRPPATGRAARRRCRGR